MTSTRAYFNGKFEEFNKKQATSAVRNCGLDYIGKCIYTRRLNDSRAHCSNALRTLKPCCQRWSETNESALMAHKLMRTTNLLQSKTALGQRIIFVLGGRQH